jgi:hypothetical protein
MARSYTAFLFANSLILSPLPKFRCYPEEPHPIARLFIEYALGGRQATEEAESVAPCRALHCTIAVIWTGH